MNPIEQSSSDHWISNEISKLQNEQPQERCVEQTARAFATLQSSTAPRRSSNILTALRAGAALTAVGALTALLLLKPNVANAAAIHRMAEAYRSQSTRHTRDLRPDGNGHLNVVNEIWEEGAKFSLVSHQSDRITRWSGYNGKRMFIADSVGSAFIDDTIPSKLPRETIEDYLKIPGGKLTGVQASVAEDGKLVDVYHLAFNNVKFDLYIDPLSGLPVRRDVLTLGGELTEREYYDYPTDISDSTFDPPKAIKHDWCDYPALRKTLAEQLASDGQTQQLAGISITFKALIVGKSGVIAVWTGGGKPGSNPQSHINLVGHKAIFSPGLTGTLPSNASGDEVWFNKPLPRSGPLKVSVPVITATGKLAGHVTFKVAHPIYANDQGRVLFRPTGSGSTDTVKTQ